MPESFNAGGGPPPADLINAAIEDLIQSRYELPSFGTLNRTLDAGELKDFTPANQYTVLLSLIHRMRVATRDDIAEMLLKRMASIYKLSSPRMPRWGN